MYKSLIALAVAGVLAGCSPAEKPVTDTSNNTAANNNSAQVTAENVQSETERLNQWFETKYEEQLQQSPLQMTYMGRKDKYDQIDDASIAAEDEQLAWLAATVEELKSSSDYAKLEPEAKTSYDVWIYQYEQAKE